MNLRADRGFTVRVIAPLLGLKTRIPGSTPVLMYHSVSDDAEPGVSPYYRIVTTPARFRAHMRILRKLQFRARTVSELESWFNCDRTGAEQSVVITFDDGYCDFYRHAYPVLREQGFTATMYLPTGYIGEHRRIFNGRECMTWAEVRELSASGVEFGSHTVNHLKLYHLSRTAILEELVRSKQVIEQQTGRSVRSFAYPYAFPQADRQFIKELRDLLNEAGYRTCATTMIGRAYPHSDQLAIKRLPVNDDDDEALFRAKLDGGYDWLGTVQAAFKQLRRLGGRPRVR